MKAPRFDVTPFLKQDEGQHFERKSLFEGPAGTKRQRDRQEVRDQVARQVAAFANAEGGVLILGIEDDLSITGHAYRKDALEKLLATPRSRLTPPQPPGFVVPVEGGELIVFDVPPADGAVQVIDGRWPLRMGAKTVQSGERRIAALKLQGMAESWEGRPSSCRVADLSGELLARARQGAGLSGFSDEEYLLKRKLADRRGRGIALLNAAALLFSREGPDHPNAGVRFFRVVGTERRTGPEYNVEERPRCEGPLPEVIEQISKAIGDSLRRPARLVGSLFRAAPEYPDFAWQEAVYNAITHRDYRQEGRSIEVWLYDDHMEVFSPGGLVKGLTVERLLRLERTHLSRNPRIARALSDLGIVRDQGEGIPRMFAEMDDAFLARPEIEADANGVVVKLRNKVTINDADRVFIARLGVINFSNTEFRVLLHAHRNGRIQNADVRAFSSLDTLGANSLLRELRDRNLLVLHRHGANSYYTLSPELDPWRDSPSGDRDKPAPSAPDGA